MMGKFALGKWFLVMLCGVLLIGCDKRKPPEVIENPRPPDPPPQHIITEFLYVQFTWGKEADSMTMQEPDELAFGIDGLSADTVWVNIPSEIKNEAVIDTMDTVLPMRNKAWLYCPQSAMFKGKYYAEVLKTNTPDQTPDAEIIDTGYYQSFYLSFPYVTEDTVQFWDIKDYLENPTIKRGVQKWGRIGDSDKSYMDSRTGVVISYIDEFGEYWSTDNHPNFQPFGFFSIDQVKANLQDTGYQESHLYVQAHFEARLYNDIGYWKDMRAGKLRMRILTKNEEELLGPVPTNQGD